MSADDATGAHIESLVQANPIMLFMKGNRQAPQCGFSATVVRILDSLVPDYHTADVLQDPPLRDGIKAFSSWPTIPQLYVKGEFVGGCDIVQELFQSGELHEKLGVEYAQAEAPEIQISAAATEALRQVVAQQGGEALELHLQIDARYQNNLHLAPVNPGEIEIKGAELSLFMDPLTAQRAAGLRIDVVDTPEGQGFHIENPNAPQVEQLPVRELHDWLQSKKPCELLDVRTPEERAMASIDTSVLLTAEEAKRIESLPKDTPLVFHCKMGGRSQQAAEHFASLGFTRVYNVVGGMDAWLETFGSDSPAS